MESIRKLPELIRPYRAKVVLSLIFLVCSTAAQLAVPPIIQEVIDIGLVRGEVNFLFTAALAIAAIGVARAGLAFWQRYLSEQVGLHVAYDLRNRLYDHIQHLSFSYHDHAQTGQLISRCIEDVSSIRRFIGFGLVELIRILLLMAGIVFWLFWNEPQLAAVALLPMIPLVLATTRFGGRVSRLFLAVDQALGELSSRLQENVSGVQVVRAFARVPYEIERFDQANRELYDARVTVVGEWSKIMPTTRLLVAFSTALILWFGGQMVLRGELTLGAVVAFNSFVLLLAQPTQQLAWLVNLAGEAAAGLKRTHQILDRLVEIQSPPDARPLPHLSGWVEFRDVWLKYAGEREFALQGIDLAIESGQTVALIGATGSGKSALVNLIPRFYDVSRGAVLLDGIDVRQADLASLRSQIGVVPQVSLLFSTSIRENIAYGRPGASEEDVIAAAKASQAHEFILAMPQGYGTIVGERGVTLSGGQRQRVAIARALLLDPRILILDDATSSVDTETERALHQALARVLAGRTTFLVAQRLATVRNADLILVLEGGRIVERGTHAELLERRGLYREIYELQWRRRESQDGQVSALAARNSRSETG